MGYNELNQAIKNHKETMKITASNTEYELDLTTSIHSNLEGTFTATCNDTEEKLIVNGWNFDIQIRD